jgi:hypothetical protein
MIDERDGLMCWGCSINLAIYLGWNGSFIFMVVPKMVWLDVGNCAAD